MIKYKTMRNSALIRKLVQNLLSGLSDRQKDVLTGRYGLDGNAVLTLAEIGEKYGITRERVRQIESLALGAVKQNLESGEVKKVVDSAAAIVKKFGGVRKDELLLTDLECSGEEMPHLTFLLEASNKCRLCKEDKDFSSYWHINSESKNRAAEFIKRLQNYLKDKKTEIIEHKNFDKLFAQAIKPHNLQDAVAMNFVSISKKFGHNTFGDFGLTEWPEIVPQNAKDWAYLVLKKNQKPLHFSDISGEIRKHRKDAQTNTQTVHNELIKDDRFVLVGRGTYGLREFGILPGVAKDVIKHFLKKQGPLKSKEVVQFVLQERAFKENTILLNLQDKKHFKRLDDGRYTLV